MSLGHIVTMLMFHTMRGSPEDPAYPSADRLILSAGHAFPSVYAVFLTMLFVGFTGMMRHIYDPTAYDFLKQMIPWNRFITWAAFTLFFAQLIFRWNRCWSIWRGRRVSEPDPSCTIPVPALSPATPSCG